MSSGEEHPRKLRKSKRRARRAEHKGTSKRFALHTKEAFPRLLPPTTSKPSVANKRKQAQTSGSFPALPSSLPSIMYSSPPFPSSPHRLRSSSHPPNRPRPHSSCARSRAARRQHRTKKRASRVRLSACGPLRGPSRHPRRGREAARGVRARLHRKGTDAHCTTELVSVSFVRRLLYSS